MLLLTAGIVFVLFITSYLVFDRDILCPPTVVCMVLLFGCLCAFYNEERWALEFSFYTTIVIVVGLCSFIIGGLLSMVLSSPLKNNRIGFNHSISSVEPLDIEKIKTFVIVGVQIVTMVILYREERRITGGSSWLTVVAKWRLLTGRLANLDDMTIRLSKFLRLFLQINLAFGFTYVYVVGNDFAAHKKQKLLNWAPIILCTTITFLQGYRGDMLRMWVMMLVISFTLRKRSNGWGNNSETNKMIQRMALSVVAIALLFSIFRSTVGRTSDKDPLSYLTFYAGCPVAALDEYLKQSHAPSEIWGKETFYDLNQTIRWLTGNSKLRYIFYKEFIQSPNGTYIGNVYTAFRPPYADFGGLGGMAIYMMIFGSFFTFFYDRVRVKRGNNPIDLRLLLYAYCSYTFFMYFYNLYNSFITHMFLRLILEIIIIRWFLVGIHFKINHPLRIRWEKAPHKNRIDTH